MPEISPAQALCALMLGTGEQQLILDAEVLRAVEGVTIDVEWHHPTQRWLLTFKGMPDKTLLEAKGMRVPDVAAGFILAGEVRDLGPQFKEANPHPSLPPREKSYEEKYGVPFDPGPRPTKYADEHDPVPDSEVPQGKDWISGG